MLAVGRLDQVDAFREHRPGQLQALRCPIGLMLLHKVVAVLHAGDKDAAPPVN